MKLLSGVPQGSILGPILFNIFLNDMFLFISEAEIYNFADDNSLAANDASLFVVIKILIRETTRIIEWYKINSMAANPAKFQVMFLGIKESNTIEFKVEDIVLKSTNSVKLLGVIIDCKLNFDQHIEKLCSTASQKVKALFRIRPFLDISCDKQLCNSYILSTFCYCPLILMFCSKRNNNMIDVVHKRALRAVYQIFNASLSKLLTVDQSSSIHVRNLRFLLIEIFKSLNSLNPEFMWGIFKSKQTPYNFRSGASLKLPCSNTIKYGTNSIVFSGSLLWCNLPNFIKSSSSISSFKRKLNYWSGSNCTCQVCKL